MVETVTEPIPGYDVPAVEAWVGANTPLAPPFEWTRLTGGHSNLTWRIDDAGGRRAVIRRPPLGELLPKAHDMAREWAVLRAIAPSLVPAPEAIGFCADVSVTGAQFYVMGWVEGRPLHNAADTLAFVPERDRRSPRLFVRGRPGRSARDRSRRGGIGRAGQARQLCGAPALHLAQVMDGVGRAGRAG